MSRNPQERVVRNTIKDESNVISGDSYLGSFSG